MADSVHFGISKGSAATRIGPKRAVVPMTCEGRSERGRSLGFNIAGSAVQRAQPNRSKERRPEFDPRCGAVFIAER